MNEREKKIADAQSDIISAYKIFQTPEGIKVLKELEKYCNFDRTTKDQNMSIDEMTFKEGKRAVFLHIKKKLESGRINFYQLLQ